MAFVSPLDWAFGVKFFEKGRLSAEFENITGVHCANRYRDDATVQN